MKVTSIDIYRKKLSYIGGIYRWGRGNAITTARSTVVVIGTDAGLSGAGEFCPCGENYMEAHGEGTEAAARLLAPALLGQDPRQVSVIERVMDNTIRGHGYAKAPFDAACWDILGKSVGQPVWMLLGGKHTDGAPLYKVAPQNEPTEMVSEMNALRDQGYRQFQIKVGANWVEDIERIRATVPHLRPGEKAFADANQGWRVDEALRVGKATRDLDYIMEQPCQTYEECMQVRRKVDQPMKLDECIDSFGSVELSLSVPLRSSASRSPSKAAYRRPVGCATCSLITEFRWSPKIAGAARSLLRLSPISLRLLLGNSLPTPPTCTTTIMSGPELRRR